MAACGSGKGGRTTASGGASAPASFPSPTDIAALVRGTPPRLDIQPTSTLVERWTLDGALPAKLGTVRRAPSTRWDTALADAARGEPGVTLTDAMHCTAREVGRFYLEHRKRPSQGLEQFIISRCGSAAVTVGVGMVGVEVAESTTEGQVAASIADSLADLLAGSLSGGAREVGIWFGRGDGYGVVAVATGRAEVEIARVDHVPDDDGRIVVEGTLLVAAQSARALISTGSYGASRCAMDPLVALPRFVAICLPDPTDATAWVELSVFPPDRVLGHTALRVLVWPAGQPPTQYVRLAYSLTRAGRDRPRGRAGGDDRRHARRRRRARAEGGHGRGRHRDQARHPLLQRRARVPAADRPHRAGPDGGLAGPGHDPPWLLHLAAAREHGLSRGLAGGAAREPVQPRGRARRGRGVPGAGRGVRRAGRLHRRADQHLRAVRRHRPRRGGVRGARPAGDGARASPGPRPRTSSPPTTWSRTRRVRCARESGPPGKR